MPDVVVIGGGISGLAAAHALASEGRSVVLIDRYGPAAMASGWTLAGVRQSGRHPAELPLAEAAVSIWQSLDEKLGSATGYRQGGNLRLARTQEEAHVIRALVAEQRALGLDIELLDGASAVRAVAPCVSDAILCASHCRSDGHADPDATARAYVTANQRLGIDMRWGIHAIALIERSGRIEGVMTHEGPIMADHVVLAGGFQGNALLAPFDAAVPIDVHMVTVVLSGPTDPVLQQVIGVANADCAGRQQIDGRFRFTGGLMPWHGRIEEAGERPRISSPMSALQPVLDIFGKIVPDVLDLPIENIWSGLIDLTPDALPVLDNPADIAGLTIAMGFSGHGFCLGPVTGEIVHDLVCGTPSRHPIGAFRHDRFEGAPIVREAVTLHG